MFAKTTNVGFAQRVVATLVASAVVMASYGVYNTAQAANLTLVSNTLSSSNPDVTSSHTFAFTVPASGGTAIAPAGTTTISFPAGVFTGVGTVVDANATVSVGGSDVSGAATVTASGDDVTITGITVTAGQEVVVAIADSIITNPSKLNPTPGVGDSYEFTIATPADSAKTRVVIVDTVQVSAVVNTTFDFTISGTGTSTAVNSGTSTGATTATEIPFGVLEADTAEILAQQLTVSTNARNGFSVTVETDGDLQSSTGAVIDTFFDGTDETTPTSWQAPANTITDEKTWGHWGLTSDDSDLAAEMVTGDSYIAASTTPREVFSHNNPADGSTQDIGTAIVGYQIEITALQEAGDDYNTTLTYIATPTF